MSDALFTATWVFVLGSAGGVLLERVWMRLLEGPDVVDPRSGLLYVPFNPLYGFAAVIGSLVLAPLAESPALVFLVALVIFTLVEGVASLVMEGVFGVVFWDYSDRRLNLWGRVCLDYAVLWGALGLALVYLVDPALRSTVELLPRPGSDIAAVIILALVTTAAVLTLTGFVRLRSAIAGWPAATATPAATWDRIIDRLAPPDAVAAAFPHMNLSVRYRRLRNREPPGRRSRDDVPRGDRQNRNMSLVAPMLAKSVERVPEGDLLYEPKWDGFRGIVQVSSAPDGHRGVEIGSRGDKPLTRYFPELVEAFARLLPPCVLDGEIVVTVEWEGKRRLHWDSLTQRIHPAESRVTRLARETPASFVAFDLLAIGDRDLTGEPLSVRRAELEKLFADVPAPLHLTRTTRDVEVARRWLDEFEGAGLDGVVAKPLDQPYQPGKRAMFKIKHKRTADVVLLGYRIHKSGEGVGSLLLGLYHDGQLRPVGGVSAFSNARRLELIDELAPLVERGDDGEAVTGEKERSRFSSGKDVSFVQLRPERVLEVRYDQMEAGRFRHTVQFERWRPDRDPESCTHDQLEVPVAYDLDDVLQ